MQFATRIASLRGTRGAATALALLLGVAPALAQTAPASTAPAPPAQPPPAHRARPRSPPPPPPPPRPPPRPSRARPPRPHSRLLPQRLRRSPHSPLQVRAR